MSPRDVAWRAFQVVPGVVGIVLVGWLLIPLAPGDPVVALAGDSGDETYYAFMREKLGLDRPLPEQLATYASNVVRGNFAVSYIRGRPVIQVVAERLPATLLLALTSLTMSSVVGVAAGVVAASRPHGWRDLLVNFGAPVVVLALTSWTDLARVVRAEVLSLRQREFVEASIASGASAARVVFREILPNAMPAVLVYLGLLLAEVILVEASLGFIGDAVNDALRGRS